jgi:hypothetical protein
MNIVFSWPGWRPSAASAVFLDERHRRQRLQAAIDWIERAREASHDGGVSKGYDTLRRRWARAYPETTGYTIPTLLNAANLLQQPRYRTLALALAEYLLRSATPEGGVRHWATAQAGPIVFDTGQVVFGWLSAYGVSGDQRYLDASRRAGDWLAAIQDTSGAWNDFQHLGVVKVIDTRVAWALVELYEHTQVEAYRAAAIRNLDWALEHQEVDGWFRSCTFVDREDPYTHTLAYTAEGLLQCGLRLGQDRYIRAARTLADALLARQHRDGRLVATYGPGWRATSRSTCLTGNCQMACLWIGLYEVGGEVVYVNAARAAISFVCRIQDLTTRDINVRGGIPGSYPIYGRYERFKYPNWAAKFLADSLMALECVEGHVRTDRFAG